MEEVVRNVIEIEPADRRALRHILGQPLHDSQRVALRISSHEPEDVPLASNGDQDDIDETLPEWCDVYEGLSDDEIAAIEEVMLTRANLTRNAE